VIHIHYIDTLSFSYDETEIYSSYHSQCDYCREHVGKIKANLIVVYKIYPKGIYPDKTYKQRKQDWKKFKFYLLIHI
jgi:hypothetical protein